MILAFPARVGAQPASAPPVTEEHRSGKHLFEKALRHYEAAEYDEAIWSFRAVYELTRAPALLFNMGQAYRLKGDCRKAVDLYHQFIRLHPDSPDRQRAEARRAQLEPCPAPKPPSAPPQVSPTEPAAPASPASIGTGGRFDPVALRGLKLRTAGIVLAGVAVGLGATGAYFSAQATSDAQHISDLLDRDGMWDARAADVDAHGRRAQGTAQTLFLLAGVSAVLALASYFYGLRIDN